MRVILAFALLVATPALAKAPPPDNPAIDYPAYARLVGELGPLRAERRLDWAALARQARVRGALLLDAAPKARSPAGTSKVQSICPSPISPQKA